MLTFQQMIQKLTSFWEERGCIIHQGYDLEMGAGTFNPATFLRCLGPEPYQTAYVEPSRRPRDGRYGENPNRLQLFHQFQVILKPSPSDVLETYKKSLEVIGIDLSKHDFRLVHDDWESPTIGAHGLGWEVWIDGMEVTQFTYFQAVASTPLKPVSAEITYGLERLCLYVQNKDNFFDMKWNDTYTYGEIVKENEVEWSHYNFTEASTKMWFSHFDDFEAEAKQLLEKKLPIPAYDFVAKASHAFNLLDARGAISVTERAGYIGRLRDLSRLIATEYLAVREKLGFPLLDKLPKVALPKVTLGNLPKRFSPTHKESFLLEIGSEELPATFIPIGMESLKNDLTNLLRGHELAFDSIELFGAPRRIGALISGLAEGSLEKEIERKGPACASAFDQQGRVTAQGAGFFRSMGLEEASLEQVQKGLVKGLEIRDIKGKEHLFGVTTAPGKSVYEVLAKGLPDLILNLHFPKKMRWGSLDITYPRPLQWIVALYGKTVIPFAVGTVVTGSHSFGHGQLSPGIVSIKKSSDYFPTMYKAKVLARVEERKKRIEEQLAEIEHKSSGVALQREKVLTQVLYLSEWPMLTLDSFSKEFLRAPKEVLISEMVEHQKYFPLADQAGELKNEYVITADNHPNDLIRSGNRKVLSARLADGVFLYEQDLKTPLQRMGEKLKTTMFQKDLGSVYEKMERVNLMAVALNKDLQLAEPSHVLRAASLCKADLASTVVGEFPELQGTLGRCLAKAQGENSIVAEAIEEHWMPRMEGGPLPQSGCGVILSLADKLDNLSSYFRVGLKPTSSSDPYALRRQAIGLIRILVDRKISIDLSQYLTEEVLSFVTSRAKGVFEDYGFHKDEIEASLRGECKDPYDQFCKTKALHSFRKEFAFGALFEVYKRAKGQIEKGKGAPFDLGLVKTQEERKLAEALSIVDHELSPLLQKKAYEQAFNVIAKLQHPLGALFDSVKILDEDPRIQANRIGLLQRVFAHFDALLDFGKIQR